jgi:hypothetical protein
MAPRGFICVHCLPLYCNCFPLLARFQPLRNAIESVMYFKLMRGAISRVGWVSKWFALLIISEVWRSQNL